MAMADKTTQEADQVFTHSGPHERYETLVTTEGDIAAVLPEGSNETKELGKSGEPAEHILQSIKDVAKKAVELDIGQAGVNSDEAGHEDKTVTGDGKNDKDERDKESELNGNTKTGNKRRVEELVEVENVGKGVDTIDKAQPVNNKKQKKASAKKPKGEGKKVVSKEEGHLDGAEGSAAKNEPQTTVSTKKDLEMKGPGQEKVEEKAVARKQSGTTNQAFKIKGLEDKELEKKTKGNQPKKASTTDSQPRRSGRNALRSK